MKNLSLKGALAVILLACGALVHGGPAVPGQLQLQHKDGQRFSASLKGDEHLSWIETSDGYVSVMNRISNNYEYAVLSNGKLQASGIKTAGPQTSTLQSSPLALVKAGSPAFRSFLQLRQASFSPSPVSMSGLQAMSLTSGQSHDHGPDSQWNHLQVTAPSIPLLVVLVDFNDVQIRSPVTTWAQKVFGLAAGQMNAYWQQVSNGKFRFSPAQESQGTVDDGMLKIRLASNHPNEGGGMTTEVIRMAFEQVNGFVNFASFDSNQDGIVGQYELNIVFVYAGGDMTSGAPAPNVWAAANWANSAYDGVNVETGFVRMGERHFPPPDDRDAGIGVIAHELGHAAFRLPDLYDYDNSSGGIDSFCLMSSGMWGAAPSGIAGTSPTAPSAWVRYRLGFADAVTVVPGTPLAQTLKPQSRQGKMTLIPTDAPAEYFLVENRYAEGSDISLFTSGLGLGGAMIWHIDETQRANADDARRLVDYEENPSSPQVYWPLTTGGTAFNSTSVPNSKSNSGASSGVYVSALTRLTDADHSVGFTAEKRQASLYPSMNFRGTANNWVASPMKLIAAGVWEITQNFPVGSVNPRFKFDVTGNWVTSFGDTNQDFVLEQGGGDILVTAGNYSIRLFEATMRYSVAIANLPPVANAGPDQLVLVNQEVQFDAAASSDVDGGITDYLWSNGMSGLRPTLSYASAGIRIVTLTVVDQSGARASDDVIIDVRAAGQNQLPVARIAAFGPLSAGQAVTFDGRTSSDPDGTIASYSWTINGAATTLSGATPSHTFAAAGTYAVGLQVTDKLGAQSTLTSVNVTVGPAGFSKVYPQVYYRGTSNGWAANTVMTLVANNLWSTTVTIPTSGTQAFKLDIYGNWTLSFGDNNADGLAEQSGGNITLPTGGGTYVITFNDSTRRYTMVKQSSGNQAPVAVVPASQTVTGAATAILNGSASNDPDGSITAYQWTQLSGPTVAISNATATTASVALPTVNSSTSYRFRLTVTDNAGASAFAEQVITQNPVQACTSTYTRMNLRDTSNGWASTAMTQAADCFWQTTTVFGSTATERFKFDVNGDWVTNFGDSNRDGIAEAAGADIPVTLGAGTYLVRFNDVSKRYTLVKQ